MFVAHFFQEDDVFLLLGDLLAQTRQFGTLCHGQRLVVTGCRGLDAPSLVGDPPSQQTLIHTKLASNFGDRAPGIDHPMSGLNLVFGIRS